MRVLFVFQDLGRVRYFESALEELAARGHTLQLVVERLREKIPGQRLFVDDLCARYPGVTLEAGPRDDPADEQRRVLAQRLRLALDHLHYLQPRFDDAPGFRARAERDAPQRLARLSRNPLLRPFVRAGVRSLERSLPAPRTLVHLLEDRRPDLVLVTPLIWFGSPQVEWIRAARELGIRAGGCLFSWDNLTSKGALREPPDFLTVWNEPQREEAAGLHGMPRDRIDVTGAQNWDHWFSWQPTRTREELCTELGLPVDRKLVLYVESSGFVGGERELAERWLASLREGGGPLSRNAGVIFRPHPQVVHERRVAEMKPGDGAAVWPAGGAVPLDEPSRRDYFDSLHHADAVVGVNTSSFIEASILRRPILSLTLPDRHAAHLDTVHFHHLLPESDGPLRTAASLGEHLAQLEQELADPAPAGERADAFVARFVRPFGRDAAAAPRFADAVEREASGPAVARSTPRRPLLSPLVLRLAATEEGAR